MNVTQGDMMSMIAKPLYVRPALIVITSYSIHYTKLYEDAGSGRGGAWTVDVTLDLDSAEAAEASP